MSVSILEPLSWATIEPRVAALLETELTTDNVDGWLREWSDVTALLNETGAQIYRTVSENTADEEAEKRFLSLINDILPPSQIADEKLRQKLLNLEGYRPSSETELIIRRFRSDSEMFREENVPLLSELTRLGTEYEKLAGAMTIQWEGQEETLPQAEVHLQEADRETRERAWRLMMDRYLEDREKINEVYLKQLELRRQVARNAGFDSFRDYQWQAYGRFDYTPEDARSFHDAIEHEVVPLARLLYSQLAERLGLDTLRPWDTKVEPYGDSLRPFDDPAELEETGSRIFEQVDPVLAGYYTEMRDGFLDLASRPNKSPGAYCNSFPVSGKPYIFMSAVGTHRDVSTLLHEGGHAFHFMASRHHPLVWNHSGPTEFCEVASMAMELLSAPYLVRSKGGFYEEADARRAYASQLREVVFFLPYMAVVDAFQQWVYTEAAEDVTAADLDAKWSELWDRFMQGIDYSGLQSEKETGWHRKIHLYSYPLYYIEYGLAQLGALQVWRNALKDQAQAVADYRSALALGGTRPLPELFEAAGATFAFDRAVIGDLMALIREQLSELETGETV